MAQSDDQNNSSLRASGYGPRLRQTLIIVVAIGIIAIAIILAAIWANSRDPEVGVQPTPRPTQPPQPTETPIPPTDTATPEPTEPPAVKIADTPTPSPEADTPTPTAETATATETPTPSATDTPVPDIAPTPEPTEAPTDTPTPVPPTPEPAPTATNTPPPTSTPTIPPTPEPTATPTVTPTPAPTVPTRLEIYARGQLIDQGIEQGDLKILSVTEHVWPDTTLGCGYVEGNNPAQAVEGWILEIGNEQKTYTFHIASTENKSNAHLSDDIIANCTDVANRVQPTVNLVHDLRLHEARRAVLYRGSPGGEEQPVQDIDNPAQVQILIDALNTPIPIGNTAICETAFRLDFYILRGIETVRFFCRDDWYRVGGQQDVWGETQGALPKALLDAVSPYFAAEPIPALPTFEPEE